MLVPISRVIALAMAAVLCFGILVPLSVSRHHVALAAFVAAIFIAYLVGNVALWQRMRPRA